MGHAASHRARALDDTSIGRFTDVLGLVRRAPRTAAELIELTGLHANTISKYTALMRQEGLIERCGQRRHGASPRASRVYRWVEVARG